MKKALKVTIIAVIILLTVIVIALTIYSSGSYNPLDEMDLEVNNLEMTGIERHEDFDEITFTVSNPQKKIVFIPGGLVKPQSYEYLAVRLAQNNYEVTIAKNLFNLAILTPNYPTKFLSEELENVLIGHSLGGTVASMVSSENVLVSELVLLGSYPITDVTANDVLVITAEYDLIMNR